VDGNGVFFGMETRYLGHSGQRWTPPDGRIEGLSIRRFEFESLLGPTIPCGSAIDWGAATSDSPLHCRNIGSNTPRMNWPGVLCRPDCLPPAGCSFAPCRSRAFQRGIAQAGLNRCDRRATQPSARIASLVHRSHVRSHIAGSSVRIGYQI